MTTLALGHGSSAVRSSRRRWLAGIALILALLGLAAACGGADAWMDEGSGSRVPLTTIVR